MRGCQLWFDKDDGIVVTVRKSNKNIPKGSVMRDADNEGIEWEIWLKENKDRNPEEEKCMKNKRNVTKIKTKVIYLGKDRTILEWVWKIRTISERRLGQ